MESSSPAPPLFPLVHYLDIIGNDKFTELAGGYQRGSGLGKSDANLIFYELSSYLDCSVRRKIEKAVQPLRVFSHGFQDLRGSCQIGRCCKWPHKAYAGKDFVV